MALEICLRLDEKFNKFEHNFAGLGMEMAELHKEYAKLRAEIARKEVEHCGQIVVLENEMKKLREQNGILTSRLMNNAVEDREQQLHRQNKRCRLVDIFPNVGRAPPQQQENEELATTGIHEEIPTANHNGQPLEGSNNIENLANIQFTAPNNGIDNGIPIIKQEKDVIEIIGICPGTSTEEQYQNGQQNVEPKQHYNPNPLDELNETSADGFGQIEEDGFDEEGDEIMAGTSMEMGGNSPTVREYLRERMDQIYGGDALTLTQNECPSNNIGLAEQGPSNVSIGQDGQQNVRRKIKIKNLSDMPMPPIQYSFRMEMVPDNQLICQWPGCGYRRNAKYKSDMQRHWRTHTGERPYSCTICGQSFARLDNMKKHELTQHSIL